MIGSYSLNQTQHDATGTDAALSIVIPTLNEAQTLPALISSLNEILSKCPELNVTELVFVDDGSVDGTVEFIAGLEDCKQRYSVRLISRKIRHGPAHAELEGIKRASNDLVVKLDGDGQHDVAQIPKMVGAMTETVDMVLASRYVTGGANNWHPLRGLISRSARFLSQILVPNARHLSDPISGFYVVRQSLARGLDPAPPRYKLVLYLLAMNPSARVREVPFVMSHRVRGESKVIDGSMRYIVDFLVELVVYRRCSQQHTPNRAHRSQVPTAAEQAEAG
jgi:dolichol-phosphate mannosyltransferase